jgi:tetratricopeptide (TPR) repeat protein
MKKKIVSVLLVLIFLPITSFSDIIDFQLIIDDPNILFGSVEYYSIVIPEYMKLDFLDNAEAELKDAIQKYPNESIFYYFYEDLMYRKNNAKMASKYKQLSLQIDGFKKNSKESYIRRAKKFLDINSIDMAFKEIAEGIKIFPNSAEMYFIKGRIIFHHNDIENEIQCYTRAIEIDKSNAVFYFVRAGAYSDIKEGAYPVRLRELTHCHAEL